MHTRPPAGVQRSQLAPSLGQMAQAGPPGKPGDGLGQPFGLTARSDPSVILGLTAQNDGRV
eukprot:NODE_17957_length_289_cov_5.241667_g16789_i0.p3 GENE.NODE_17957_length_289_cov_5.241667_g16789_i0~~NODE_17957_length_289_cov_5.241667_g16789_i0.p3  ORF type:complete len:61 (+),score=3.19 NODE_17957_length_289_cov_5.241667_g16789_i0:59-241(+)